MSATEVKPRSALRREVLKRATVRVIRLDAPFDIWSARLTSQKLLSLPKEEIAAPK
jgi:hypothetical protein